MDDLKRQAESAGGQEWTQLVDALSDTDFHSILTNNERNLLQQWRGNSHSVNSYRDNFADILAKYIAWSIQKKTKISTLVRQANEIEQKLKEASSDFAKISASAKFAKGAAVLVDYAKEFNVSAEKHRDKAKEQLKYYLTSLVAFAIVVGLTFFVSVADFTFMRSLLADDLKALPLHTGLFAVKVFLLFFTYQVTQFFKKNYGAEKHLEETYMHRADVLQSLHAVYNTLDSSEERDKILAAGALFAYERGESGYITTKEGAGSGDMVDGFIGRFLK